MKQILLALAVSAGFFMFLFAVQANAMPIRPDLEKILAQPQEAAIQFAPARAGWRGPEMNPAASSNRATEVLTQSPAAKEMRAALVAAAIPDPRAVLLIALTIVLLRRVRKKQPA